MKPETPLFKTNAKAALADPQLQRALAGLPGGLVAQRAAARDRLPEFEALRYVGRDLRNDTMELLDVYLETYEKNATAAGAHVHWAETASDARRIILELGRAQGAPNLTFSLDIAKLLVNRPIDTEVDPVPKSLVTAWSNGKGVELATGLEYWYEKLVALRAGYFTESANGGNRAFLTFGAGLRYDIYGFDFSYINTNEDTHPLGNTLRFTLVVDFDKVVKETTHSPERNDPHSNSAVRVVFFSTVARSPPHSPHLPPLSQTRQRGLQSHPPPRPSLPEHLIFN